MDRDKNSMSECAEFKTLRKLYSALNHGDIEACMEVFDPAVVRVEFEGTPSAGRFRGLAEVKAHFVKGRATWAEGACEPERFVSSGDKVVVCVHVRVRLKDKADWIEGRVGDVFTFRNGKVTEFRSFMDVSDALSWAGAGV